jgi:hypothetical protein
MCEGDGDVFLYNQGTLITNATILGKGVYQESGTQYFKFSPKLAGSGYHTIKYYYSDNAGCDGWDSIRVKVLGKPTVKLWVGDCVKGSVTWNVLIYASQSDPDIYSLQSSEWSGTSKYNIGYNPQFATKSFWGSTNSSSIPGHTYWFKVSNSIGCSDSVAVTIGAEKPIHLAYESSGCITKGIDVTALYNTTKVNGTSYPGNLIYVWDNEDTAFISTNTGLDPDYNAMQNIGKAHSVFGKMKLVKSSEAKHKVYTTGWHKVRILTLGGCEYSDSVLIPFECSNCKDTVIKDIIITTFEKWDGKEKVINGDIIIEAGGSLELNNCNLHLTPCSRIIVKNNYHSVKYSANLTIINSTLDGCSNWKGIEVWGSPDLYDYNGININLGDDPRTKLAGTNTRLSNNINTTHSWAYVYIKNSVIKDADIAIFVGKYDDNDNRNFANEEIAGGMAFVDNSYFKNNYADIVFTPRPGAQLSSGHQSWNASYVVKCTFDSIRRSNALCNKMYWCDQNGTNNPEGKQITHLSPECHIVDLTESLYQDQLSPLKFFAFTGSGFNEMSGGTHMVNTTLKRDERIPYTIPHAQYNSNSIPLHLGVYSISQIQTRFQNIMPANNCNDW